MRRHLLLALVASVAFSAACSPASLDTGSGDAVDHQRLEAIKTALDAEVANGIRAGFVAGVATRRGDVFTTASGMADRENNLPMTAMTRFRIASMTKPIITAAVMQLVDRGVIALDDPVSRYVPAYADARVAMAMEPDETGEIPTRAPSRPITVLDLLTHTAGIGYLFNNQTALDRLYLEGNIYRTEGTLEERIARIARLPLYTDPGVEWRYSYSMDVAGLLIENATGEPLEAWLKANLFEPLGMSDTEFFVDATDFGGLAVVYEFGADGKMRRAGGGDLSTSPNDEAFGFASGGGGLVSTVGDYLRFCVMLLRGGEIGGARVLSRDAVGQMMSDNLPAGAVNNLWEKDYASFGLGGTSCCARSSPTPPLGAASGVGPAIGTRGSSSILQTASPSCSSLRLNHPRHCPCRARAVSSNRSRMALPMAELARQRPFTRPLHAPISKRLPGASGRHSPGPYLTERELPLAGTVVSIMRRPPEP